MYCSKCGNKVEEGRRECPYCGASLVQAEIQPEGTSVQSAGVKNESAAGTVQPAEAAEAGTEAAVAFKQNGAPGLSYQPEHLPQSQQELKEYLTQLAQAEAAPVSASAVNHLVKSGFSTGAVVRFYGAGWISKQLYPFLQPGERVLALFHIQNRVALRGVRTFLTVTDRRIFRVDKYHIFMKTRIKGVSLSQITSIGAETEKNWFYSTFIGEKVQICAADGILKLRMVGCGKAQKLKQALTEYLAGVQVNPACSNSAYTNQAYANPAYTNPADTSRTKKSKKGLLIGLAAGVLVLGGAAYVAGSILTTESQTEEIKRESYGQADFRAENDSALASGETEPQETAAQETSAMYAQVPETEPDTALADTAVYSDDPVVAEWEEELAYIQNMSGIDRSQYVLEWSSESYVESRQMEGMSYDIARLAVNEIYARHGRMFQNEHLQAYFDSKPWYYGTIAPDQFDEGMLSELEKGNIQTIRQYMEQVKRQ